MNSEKEKLLKETYDKFMKVSINKLPGELLDGIISDNVVAYGTAIDEKLLSIQDCRDLVERQLEQASGMKFKHERIPVSIRISPEEDSAIFVEELKLTIESKEVTHRLFLRITTALEYSDKKWKVVHFHTSKPDDTKGETDTWHIDEWKKKNEELKKLVDEKTTDLLFKNRDLEIEASLERVRTIAMGMRKSDDLLNICETLFNELKILGFVELRNTMINIHNDEEKTFINYDYSDTLGKTITPLFYNINPVIAKQVKQIRKGKDAFSETSFKGKELKEWKKFRKRKGEPDDPRINNAKALYYYFYSIGTGSIGISTFGSVIKEKLELLKRFWNVFEFAYRRYMDVMQAEEQAKEAKIEASLERVRTHSMAMKKPDDLVKVCESLFNELRTLGFMNLRNSQIVAFNDDNKSFLNYDYSDYAGANTTTILNNSHPLIQSFINKIKKSKEAFAEFYVAGKELKNWKIFRKKNGELPDPKLDKASFVYYYFYSIGTGAIGISAFESITTEELDILKRFRNVFEFAYGKHSDVTKAETQTKEAKIETALERVRSRTMAMQKSDELSETTYILFQQFIDLGEAPDQITIGIINEEEKAIEFWTTMDGNKVDMMVKFPVKDTDLMKKLYSAWKKQKKSIAIEIVGKELHDYIDYRIRLTGVSTKNDHVYDRRFIQAAFFSKGMITISTNDPRSKETLQLLERFAGVFDITYTRFLDLKQAEAQTKEAKIELSLERVRARSMAMHSSDELVDASIVLFNELKSLGIESIRTGVGIFDESKKAVEIWSSQLIEEKRNKILGVVPFKAHPFFELNYKAWKRKEPYFFYEIAGKEVKNYYKVMSSVLSYPEKKEFNPIECFYTFFFPEGSLNVVSNNYLTEDECNLILRFAKVFGMIYRRFLDLQKAEAQARESQIELALERVRARTMAMQRSDELEETSQILFQQFKELGEAPERITIGTINEPERQIELWVTVEGFQNRMVRVSIDEPNVIHKIYTAWKRQKKSILIDLKGKELRDYIAYRKSFGNDQGIGDFLKDRMIVYVAFFSKGIITITTPELLPRESIQLLERFAGVFDLTYTRFLDLQKAEEQAREALIEVALERVRSRTMAMHKSEELAETAAVLFQQLCGLGIDALRLYIGIIDEKSDEIEFWTTDYGGRQISSKYKANLYGSTTFRKMYTGWKEKQKSTIVDPKGKELTEHLYYLKEIMNYPIRNRKALSRRLQTIAYFSKGLIGVLSNNELPKESINLLERFAGVFDLTYRRFLDLQISEAQTKEAQIEVALERVRSRTMAMHSSDELHEAAILLFQQIKELGVDTGSCGYVIWENKNKNATVWMSSAEGGFQESFKLPHTKSKIYKEIYSAQEEGKEFFVKEVRGAELKKHFDYLTTVPGIGEKIKELRKASYKFPETITYNNAFFKQGYLSFHTHEQIPDAQDIFRRFANVFEQTYTRFLDLQKAEAQAREAQIELGLERVRTRAMAMQKSDELSELVDTVFKELTKLDFALTWCIINIIDESSMSNTVWAANPDINKAPESYHMLFEDYPFHHAMMKGWKERKAKDVYVLGGPEKIVYDDYLFNETEFRRVPAAAQAISRAMEKYVVTFSFSNFGGLQTVGDEPLSEANIDILSRFGKVFDLTYTRFNDLKLAEAQAAEAKIEAALERVRSRTMGMQKSEELKEVIQVVLEQFIHLNINAEHAGFVMDYKEREDYNIWVADPLGVPSQITIPYFDSVYYNRFNEAKIKGEDFFAVNLTFKEKNIFYKKLFKYIPGLPEEAKEFYFKCPGLAASTVLLENVSLYIENFSGIPYTDEENNTLMRFGKVFQQTYTRFLDLQKAEAQAREAQIETALERVRSQSMGMQTSKDLSNVTTAMFEQLRMLGGELYATGIVFCDKHEHHVEQWHSVPGAGMLSPFIVPVDLDYIHQYRYDQWKKGVELFSVEIPGDFIAQHFEAMFSLQSVKSVLDDFEAKNIPMPETPSWEIDYGASFKQGYILVSALQPFSNADILPRFAKVFEQTYTRFLDLQKAEAQAREAQIEAALEKVRSRSLAMHKADELGEVITVVVDKLKELDFSVSDGVALITYSEGSKDLLEWMANPGFPSALKFHVPYFEHPVLANLWKAKNEGKEFIMERYTTEENKSFLNHIFEHSDFKHTPQPIKDYCLAAETYATSIAFQSNTSIFINDYSGKSLSEQEIDILKRFSKVFEQAYVRFLDLQKAEAQAREARIEAALEKVRGKAMAMHNSNDLTEAAGQVFTELNNLGIRPIRSGFVLLTKESRKAKLYPATSFDNKNTISFTGEFEFTGHPVYEKQYESWQKKENYFPVLEGDLLKTYYKILAKGLSVPYKNFPIKNKKQFGTFLPFKEGFLFTWSDEPYSETEINILDRFKSILDLTIRRYLDLQKAEAQTREAQIEAGLERVRSRAMSMHKTDELLDAAELVYKELSALGITSMNVSYAFVDEEEKYASYYSVNPVDGKTLSFPFVFPHTETEVMRFILSSWKKRHLFNVIDLDEKETLKHQTWAGEHIQSQITKNNINIPFSLEAFLAISPKTAVIYTFNFSKGYLFVIGEVLLTKMQEDLLLRFTKVFEQAYIRFLDLQKAEAQAREAKIEAALERARTQSMLMQHSNELNVTSHVFHEQLQLLGIDSEFSFVWLPDEKKNEHLFWTAWSENKNGSVVIQSKSVIYPLDKTERYTAECFRAWESNKPVHEYFVPPEEINNYFAVWSEILRGAEHLKPELFKKGIYYCEAFIKYGCFGVELRRPLTDEEKKILLRFAIEFERAYTRFLDLQKAEAQTREAQIEASLERVRSKTMAMHNSIDVGETVSVMFDELVKLGIETYRCGIGILDEAKEMEVWTAKPDEKGKVELIVGYLNMSMHPLLKGAYENWKNKKESYYYHLKGKDLINYFNAINKHQKYPVKYNFDSLPGEIFHHDYYFREGTLFVFTLKNLSAEDESTLKRFAGVFGQTYRRYLDLQKAEAQSRESQIEASLERVRSKAMAMQKSDDLGVTVATIFEELDKLDLGTFRCGIGIIDKAKKSVDVWATAMSDVRKTVQVSGDESMDTHPLLKGAFDAWLKQEDFSYLLQGDDLRKYYEVQRESNFSLPDSQSILYGPDELEQYYYVATFQAGGLFAFRESEFPDEAKIIIKRFADVINFTYTRFNDLKQAEAQAREAQIEAALERVRASALIMRKPEDMFDVCKIISDQLVLLNVNEIRNAQTVILNDGKETYQNYEYFPDYNEKTFSEIDYNLHPKVTEFVNEIKKSSDAFFTASFEGKELQEWRDYRKNTNQIPDAKLDAASSVHYYFFSIGPGALGISTYVPLIEDQINIFKRFRNVFELAYRRYIDIEQAEAQAREAQIEAALERVRSRTLAMQKSDELAETAAVVFKQLISLGIEPNRLYIGIIKDENGEMEFWITDEDGSRVSNQFSGNKNRNVSIQKMYDGWKSNQKSISIDMQGKELEEYFHHLSDELHVPFKQGLSQKRRVQSIAYFSHGFIGIASPEPLSEETTFLLERFAAVFNLTYARFNDLKVAEHNSKQAHIDLIKLQTEKKRAEDALTELRATQAQLIQSEKMASLGELTAGIAHEIQNPLNFVNNFSEVNTELIDELNEELSKGNFEDAVVIAKDIKENEEKIKHHGKRAEGIVKGMLQHSRSSSGVKEPVNINALADEYLRLAYHGLRAKDKTFNAKMETDFDESIGKINVIPQDIGRVILNLITNAFYAVDEKKKLLMINGYEPTVTVITKRENNNALITVKDNGNGIPKKVMDKIFQPFFTTKPTGQGTGLGLSMSYDIIKAHGGELKVETKEGEGAEFIIVLPLAENK